jgi:hypothetical protein
MKYKNAIILTGKDILIVFICFFMFMFLSGGGTQNVLAAEDEVTITLDANGGKAVDSLRLEFCRKPPGRGMYLMAGGQRTVEHLLQILHGAES